MLDIPFTLPSWVLKWEGMELYLHVFPCNRKFKGNKSPHQEAPNYSGNGFIFPFYHNSYFCHGFN
jgi:hypothetical protein